MGHISPEPRNDILLSYLLGETRKSNPFEFIIRRSLSAHNIPSGEDQPRLLTKHIQIKSTQFPRTKLVNQLNR